MSGSGSQSNSENERGELIPAILLAAGQSSRLGSPKQMIRVGAETLLERAARFASLAGADPIIVVLGAQAERMQSLSFPGNAIVVVNREWEEGVSSSIRLGLQTVIDLDREVAGVLLMVCDQPSVSVSHLRSLLAQTRQADGAVETVASSYAGITGTPAVFPERRFRQLLDLQGDKGARSLLRDPVHPPILVPLSGGEIDIDTPDDLSAWQGL